MHAADPAHRSRLPRLMWLDAPHGDAAAGQRSGSDGKVSSQVRQGSIRSEYAAMQSPGARRSRSTSRKAAADAEGWEMLPVSWAVGWRKKLAARWTPVQVVLAAVASRHGIPLPAQSVPLVLAAAGAPEHPDLPVAAGYAALPLQSGLMKSMMAQAELSMGSRAQPAAKKLREPVGAEMDSVWQ